MFTAIPWRPEVVKVMFLQRVVKVLELRLGFHLISIHQYASSSFLLTDRAPTCGLLLYIYAVCTLSPIVAPYIYLLYHIPCRYIHVRHICSSLIFPRRLIMCNTISQLRCSWMSGVRKRDLVMYDPKNTNWLTMVVKHGGTLGVQRSLKMFTAL